MKRVCACACTLASAIMYVYTVCDCVSMPVSMLVCIRDSGLYFIYIFKVEKVNTWPGWPLPEVTMDLHM